MYTLKKIHIRNVLNNKPWIASTSTVHTYVHMFLCFSSWTMTCCKHDDITEETRITSELDDGYTHIRLLSQPTDHPQYANYQSALT